MSAWAHLEPHTANAPHLAAHHYVSLLCFYLGEDFRDEKVILKYHPANGCSSESHFGCRCPAPLTWRLSGF